MNHRPFEDWLLEEKPLSTAEKRQLDAHLRACESCAALTEVNLALHSVKAVAPAAGFANRFQIRLAEQRKAQRRRVFWGFFILALSVAGVAAWLAWPVLAMAVESPADLVGNWMSYLVSLWVSIQALVETGLVFLKVVPGFIPPYAWVMAVLALSGLSLLWVASLTKFAKLPQGV